MVVLTDLKELCNRYGIERDDMELISKRFIEYLIPEVRDETRDDDVMLAEYRAMVAMMFTGHYSPKPERVTRESNEKISEEVGYWRKADPIYKWFFDNVQDGIDNCATYPVAYEQLQELLSLINQVLDNHKLAAKLLPIEAGFLFDSYEYEEWYFNYLETTKRIIEVLPDDVEYEYTASW